MSERSSNGPGDDDALFAELLCRYLDNELSANEQPKLERLLEADAERRKLLVTIVEHRTLMREILGQQAPHEDPVIDPDSRAVGPSCSSPSKIEVQSSSMSAVSSSKIRRYLLLSLAAAALVLIVALTPFAFISNWPFGGQPTVGEAPGESREVVATITWSLAPIWGVGSDIERLDRGLLANERVVLQSGLLEIVFKGGAIVRLEGPAEFHVDTSEAGTLAQGALAAYVPEKAAGFTVHAEAAKIVDWGTQFGVAVGEDQLVDVQVFEGVVEVTSSVGTNEATRLSAGETLSVAVGEAPQKRNQADAGRFAKLLTARSWAAAAPHSSLLVSNGDFEAQADGSQRQDVPFWFDSELPFVDWVNPGSANQNGSENLGLGARDKALGYAYQSLGVFQAKYGHRLHWSFDQVMFSDGNASNQVSITFYAGPFPGARRGADIEGHVDQPEKLATQTFHSLIRDQLDQRTNSGTVDLSGVPEGTEIWVRIASAGGQGTSPHGTTGFGPVDNVNVWQGNEES